MDVTRFAIEKNRVTIAALIAILLAGLGAYKNMPRAEDPGFIIRTALVQTVFPGASPERVEMLVTDKLEKVIQEMPQLDSISSTSKVGLSIIYVNIKEEYKNMRPIWDDLRRKVDRTRDALPESVIGPSVNDEFGDVFGSIISITGDGFEYRDLKRVADEVRDELLLIPEAAKVEIVGAQEERIFAEFDNARLAEAGISPLQLRQALQARNIIQPGGDITTYYEKIVLEPSGSFLSIEELERTVINVPGTSEVIRLRDIVSVRRGYLDPPEKKMRFSGEPSLALAVSLREGGNILDLGQALRDTIAYAQSVYPIGIEFDIVQFQADSVDRKIQDFVKNLVQAVIIVTLVMLAFLGLRTGLVVASLIPSAIVASLLVMSLFSIGLNQMSLASLIIALGMLVDNAIVMSENIMVQMEAGKRVREAAVDSARELRVPLLTSSLTTSAAFLPIFLSESSTGEYTAPLFKVVTITLLCSWVMALTLIPLLCVFFLRVKARTGSEPFSSRAYQLYRKGLLLALRRPWLSVAGVVLVFAVAMKGFALVPNIFFPPNDKPIFTIDIDLPVGAPLERTDEVVSALEGYIDQNLRAGETGEGIVSWASFIGEGAPRFVLAYNPEPPTPDYALLLVNATSAGFIASTLIPDIERYIASTFPEVNATVRLLANGAPAWPPVAVRVSGRDTDVIFGFAEAIRKRLETVPGARQVSDDWGPRSKKVAVKIDDTRARLAGVSHQDIAISLQTYLTGLAATEYREEDKLIPIILRSNVENRLDMTRLPGVTVYSQTTGRSVPLSQVAEAELTWQPSLVKRRNRLRTVTIESLLEPGVTAAEVNAQMQPWLEEQAASWPFGYSWEFGGEAETSGKANAAIAEKLPVAFIIILLLLIWQFNSFRLPVIILATIPLAMIGVVVGLILARSYFGFMTLLGVISLAGIVINNAIVLLDRIRIEREENGRSAAEAVIQSAQQRARPILLTATTTIGGLLPLWLGGGPMWEPMAITIIFGLAFSTLLTLGVVPVLYSLLFRVDFSDYRESTG